MYSRRPSYVLPVLRSRYRMCVPVCRPTLPLFLRAGSPRKDQRQDLLRPTDRPTLSEYRHVRLFLVFYMPTINSSINAKKQARRQVKPAVIGFLCDFEGQALLAMHAPSLKTNRNLRAKRREAATVACHRTPTILATSNVSKKRGNDKQWRAIE